MSIEKFTNYQVAIPKELMGHPYYHGLYCLISFLSHRSHLVNTDDYCPVVVESGGDTLTPIRCGEELKPWPQMREHFQGHKELDSRGNLELRFPEKGKEKRKEHSPITGFWWYYHPIASLSISKSTTIQIGDILHSNSTRIEKIITLVKEADVPLNIARRLLNLG
jgi:hypothetical protein